MDPSEQGSNSQPRSSCGRPSQQPIELKTLDQPPSGNGLLGNDGESTEHDEPNCGLQPSQAELAEIAAEEANIKNRVDKNRRGLRKIVRNFTPS
jgi:hypothetical protein